VPDPWLCRGAPLELRVCGERNQIATSTTDPYRAEFEAVSCAIRDGRPLEFGRDDALAQAFAIDALRESAETKAVVDIRNRWEL